MFHFLWRKAAPARRSTSRWPILLRLEELESRLTPSTYGISTVAGNHTAGYSGDGGAATAAKLNTPFGVSVDAAGDLFIADTFNNVIREVSAATGKISTVAGNGTQGYSGDGGAATSAQLDGPEGVSVDAAGDLFIADTFNSVIREVNAATGKISTVAGNGTSGYGGDGGAATSAKLLAPSGVAVDAAGDLFIADRGNHVIREVNAATGKISTVAGNHIFGYSGDGGAATSAKLDGPYGVSVDAAGDLFIADTNNSVIREVNAATGKISTVAGNHTQGYGGDGGPATSAMLAFPSGVAVDAGGDLFIADTANHVIRKLTPDGFAAADFPGSGVWQYSAAAGKWTQLSPADASLLVTNTNGDVFAEFSGSGVWRYTLAAGWKQLSPADASLLAADANGDLAAEFSGSGVWRYTAAAGWKQTTTADASLLTMDAAGDVFAEFSGSGVWRYTAAVGFRQLTTADAALLAVDAAGDVAAEFSGSGVWRYTASAGAWAQLTTANASLLAMDAGGDVAADFSGSGVWLDTARGGFHQITPADAGSLGIDDAGEVVAAIPGYGVYLYYTGLYETGGFVLLSPANPSLLAAR